MTSLIEMHVIEGYLLSLSVCLSHVLVDSEIDKQWTAA